MENTAFDVVIIGAGVVGCAMARRFTLAGARVCVLEKAGDILDGASKANSAILHTGFDAPEGSLELACIRTGYDEYRAIHADMGLPLEETGAYVVAWNDEQRAQLDGILQKAHANGVTDAVLVDAATLHKAEPHLAPHAQAAIHIPGESLIDPWSAPYAYLRQSLENGGELRVNCAVTGGEFSDGAWTLQTGCGQIRATTVINCAGLYGDLVDQAVTGQADFTITPRKGQFVVFDKAASDLAQAVILPVPTARTKGIVLFRTVFGNLAVGPTAEDQQSRTDASTDQDTLRALIAAGVEMLPALADMPVTATYAGLRPASEFKDYQISQDRAPNWITVGAIRSTGLSGALGIAQHVLGLYQDAGHHHTALENPVIPVATRLAERSPRDWQEPDHGEIICHCELVTRREIEAALEGPLAARSLGGLKRQTRATMGRCQGFFCSAKLAKITEGRLTPPLGEGVKK